MIKLLKGYFIACGVAINILALALVILVPAFVAKVQDVVMNKLQTAVPVVAALAGNKPQNYVLEEDVAANFEPWQPLTTTLPVSPQTQVIYSAQYKSLQDAANALKDGDVLRIAAGVYKEALVIRANHVLVEGEGLVVLEAKAAGGKAAIVNKGSFNQIRNLECRHIEVPDRNGACVRHEGNNLKLFHVYFHDSEQGILSGSKPGLVIIENSRFLRLGKAGRAHGVYLGGGELHVLNSEMLAAKDQGHEIKTRGGKTIIDSSVISSLSSDDSRLIDISNGGFLSITNSVLHQGPKSQNQDAIGLGLEGNKYGSNQLELRDNVIILERQGVNKLLHFKGEAPVAATVNNVIIAEKNPELSGLNLVFESRKEAGMKDYPHLPIEK